GAAEVVDGALGLDRVAGVGDADLEIAEERRAEVGVDQRLARRVALARAAPADATRQRGLEELLERDADVADQLDLRLVLRVDLGGLGIDVDDPLLAIGVPAARRVLDEVVADGDDEVRAIEAG